MFSPSHSIKRASFGNAAEFFKFRRRSKSRLELAREISESKAVHGAHYVKNGSMPGIDEQMVSDHRFNAFVSSNTEQSVDDRVLANVNTSSDFIPFYHAVVSSKTSRALEIPSEHSIPPPPPEEEDSDGDVDGVCGLDSKGLPMMSPNGVRLRKVAEMARRGSLSNADKNRFKEEIIQSSLGIGLTSVRSAAGNIRSSCNSNTELADVDVPLEERLRVAAQLVADCVNQGKMTEFHVAMKQLDALRTEATSIMEH